MLFFCLTHKNFCFLKKKKKKKKKPQREGRKGMQERRENLHILCLHNPIKRVQTRHFPLQLGEAKYFGHTHTHTLWIHAKYICNVPNHATNFTKYALYEVNAGTFMRE